MLRFALISLLAFPLIAQDRIATVQVRVSTDRSDWRYNLGQRVEAWLQVFLKAAASKN
jgi:hypothetical protein